MERATETRAEQAAIKASGFSPSEMGQARERTEAILVGGTPPGDLSPSEKSAVASRAAELKRLLGIREAQPAQAMAIAPAPPPTPAPTPPAAAPPAGSMEMSACMGQNAQKHEPELRALGKRGEAAQRAGNTAALLAIADTIQRLQMAGCGGGR